MDILGYFAAAVVAYLLGSIPTGYLVARARGVDIRSVGSGNIGATNVFRFLGKPAGTFVLLVDALKGFVACKLIPLVLGHEPSFLEYLSIFGGVFAVLGHNYTCWLHFKGGKGIATSAGVLVGWVPTALLATLGVWILSFLLGRYVSLASVLAAAFLPFGVWITQGSVVMIAITAGLSVLAIYKHRANIQRLVGGTEHRVSFRRPPTASAQ